MSDYHQLCGALGLLKTHDEPLDWTAINEQMRDLGRRVGIAEFGDPHTGQPATGFADPVHQEIRELHRLYRDKCLGRGLINVGYLFNSHDCVPTGSEEPTPEFQSLMRTPY